ncbi:MAG: 3-hydroxybutyryl-CoA dehydrogenase [Aestuariivirga sp.]|uniref:3-hydroxyacyl-CoA dehydrogenase n=1 Tax=Aestuariivirga sp. TaxID=2650926 RepID=UPI0025BAFF0E|nr:3-hydroxyacyl-CoA dehydrogenase NAD-binding domain-containing protein [Aestuariivirga sp.]MCA3561575.1 3-hydroxybutyryl-CoA dehydrogenase [Aestuariivirga sp.]
MTKPVIAVLGLGTMGLGIAQLYAEAGRRVIAFDAVAAARESAKDRLAQSLDARVKAGKLPEAERDATLGNLTVTDDMAELSKARLVIEAVVEDLAVKQALFAEVERHVSAETVLATNTSSLSVAAIMARLARPARGIGLHFFNPAPVMKLVELAVPQGASDEATELARSLTQAAGKTVIACRDTPGFIVNRCARPYYGEALAMLEEGRSASGIDSAMLKAGYRLGPFSLIDLIGADINLAATRGLSAAMAGHPRYHVFDALVKQVEQGHLGRKSGRGFLHPATPGEAPADWQAIARRIEAALANEAAFLAQESGLAPDDIDTALKLGLNFPRGPFESARSHGAAAILSTLTACESAAPAHLKGRYTPSPALAPRIGG